MCVRVKLGSLLGWVGWDGDGDGSRCDRMRRDEKEREEKEREEKR